MLYAIENGNNKKRKNFISYENNAFLWIDRRKMLTLVIAEIIYNEDKEVTQYIEELAPLQLC